MNIVTFCQIDESLFNPEFNVEYFHSTGTATDADIVSLKKIKQKFVKISLFQ